MKQARFECPKNSKPSDLHLISRLAVVQIVDDLLARAEPNQIDIKFVANGTN